MLSIFFFHLLLAGIRKNKIAKRDFTRRCFIHSSLEVQAGEKQDKSLEDARVAVSKMAVLLDPWDSSVKPLVCSWTWLPGSWAR